MYVDSRYPVNMAVRTVDPLDDVDPVSSLVSPRENTMPPKWERVADAIRQQIRDGRDLTEREDGRYLPSYPHLLATRWPGVGTISYGTLRQVITVLKVQGWIEGEPGIGLRVREDHPA